MYDDPLVRRVRRSAVLICVLSAVAAAFWKGMPMAFGVLGGGLLIGISFITIGSGVAAIAAAADNGSPRRSLAGALVKLAFRYALLGFLAYVMIARLRLHPIGLLVGASSFAAAVSVEAVRLLSQKS